MGQLCRGRGSKSSPSSSPSPPRPCRCGHHRAVGAEPQYQMASRGLLPLHPSSPAEEQGKGPGPASSMQTPALTGTGRAGACAHWETQLWGAGHRPGRPWLGPGPAGWRQLLLAPPTALDANLCYSLLSFCWLTMCQCCWLQSFFFFLTSLSIFFLLLKKTKVFCKQGCNSFNFSPFL